MPYYLYRSTPLHDWRVYHTRYTAERCPGCLPDDGETIELLGVDWFSQAQAEADRLNGKGNSEQGVLELDFQAGNLRNLAH